LFRVKCVMLNIGAGPLVRTLSKYFVRRAISFADYASFRDPESRGLVHEIGVTRRTHVVCDSAYSLHIPAANGSSPMDSQYKGIVGLAPMAYGDPRLSPKHDPAIYNQFIQQLAIFASWDKPSLRAISFNSPIRCSSRRRRSRRRRLRDGARR
jgi:polysaccharide pyruvyl transferase WcaK-like protein